MNNINELESLRVFRSVVDCGSFTAAAKRLHVSTGWVSKVIARLELHFKTSLFVRNTRHLHLTASGKLCYTHALYLLEQWESMTQDLNHSHGELEGKIRISAPVSWGLIKLCPLLNEFSRMHPGVNFDIDLNDQHVNVIAEQFDLVLRITPKLSDSSLLARKICSYARIACMSPQYLEQQGKPQHPKDISKLHALVYSLRGDLPKWQFYEGAERIDIQVRPQLLSNNSLLLKSALLSGQGIALIPEFLIAEELASGDIIRVLENFKTEKLNLYSLRPGAKSCSNRLAVFQEYLFDRLCQDTGGGTTVLTGGTTEPDINALGLAQEN